MKLHQLSNGQWIALDTIAAIRPCERTQGETFTHADRVVIETTSHQFTVLNCDDMEQAQAMADELAELVNKAHSKNV